MRGSGSTSSRQRRPPARLQRSIGPHREDRGRIPEIGGRGPGAVSQRRGVHRRIQRGGRHRERPGRGDSQRRRGPGPGRRSRRLAEVGAGDSRGSPITPLPTIPSRPFSRTSPWPISRRRCPTVGEDVVTGPTTSSSAVRVSLAAPGPKYDCFGAGTLVRTISGPRPIETSASETACSPRTPGRVGYPTGQSSSSIGQRRPPTTRGQT